MHVCVRMCVYMVKILKYPAFFLSSLKLPANFHFYQPISQLYGLFKQLVVQFIFSFLIVHATGEIMPIHHLTFEKSYDHFVFFISAICAI